MLLVLEDFHPYSEASNPVNIRYLREMMRPQNYEGNYKKAIILSSPSKFVPEELSKELPVIEVDLPDRDTIAIIADSVVKQYDEYCVESDITSKLLESALGLTVMEARLAFAKAIIQKGFNLYELSLQRNSLEDVFHSLTTDSNEENTAKGGN